jgi:hypothetical protein
VIQPAYRARFFFDPGSGMVLWADDTATRETYDYPIELDQLPISAALRDELAELIDEYDTSLNWDYPPDPGPWREPRCRRFNQSVREALARVREELGPGWEIADEFQEVHEDPELDRYLADPAGFARTER